MADDRSKGESGGAPSDDGASEKLPKQETGQFPKADQRTEKRPEEKAHQGGPEGKTAETPPDDARAGISAEPAAAESPPKARSNFEQEERPESARSRDSLRARASRSIPLTRTTARGLTEELVSLEEALREKDEEITETRRQLHIARERSRALSKYTKLLAIGTILLMLCVIGQIFLVEYLMRPGS